MKTLSDPKTDRSATIMNDGYVIFSRMDGSEHVPSFRKPGRHSPVRQPLRSPGEEIFAVS